MPRKLRHDARVAVASAFITYARAFRSATRGALFQIRFPRRKISLFTGYVRAARAKGPPRLKEVL